MQVTRSPSCRSFGYNRGGCIRRHQGLGSTPCGRNRRCHRRLDRAAPINELIAALEAVGVLVGRIYTVADIARDPQQLALKFHRALS